jgi:murein DD-endopeptidase MepM/ murein hydrolase activator NlpD
VVRRRGGPRRALALFAAASLGSVALIAVATPPAPAQVDDPTTTTEPAPDTTATTEPAPDTTTTTEPAPDTTTTTDPSSDTTTSEPTTTVPPDAPPPAAGTLDPGDALVPRPEFGSLSAHQRDLVQELQTATDGYALRRFDLLNLARQLTTAKDALGTAVAAESAALKREIFGLAEAALDQHAKSPAVAALGAPGHAHVARAVARGRRHDTTVDGRLAGFRALRRRLAADSKNASAATAQAQAIVTDLTARFAAQKQAVDDAMADRTKAESAIEAELGSDAVRARPDGITATLVSEQAGQPDPIVLGGIGQPIPGAALASPFGLRNDPLSGGAGFHPGIDFAATSGTPIHAAADGVVVIAGNCDGYGNCVVIDHGSSVATLYGHQSQVLVSVGQHVSAGGVIGLVGSTGMSTGPHLHFEVRVHGLPVDPILALPVA